MRIVRWLIGPPHEALHALALLLLNKRPAGGSLTHIDLPPGLSDRQFVFVALFPALAFLIVAAVGFVGLLLANTFEQAVLAALAAAFGMAGLASTAGDWQIVAGQRETDDAQR